MGFWKQYWNSRECDFVKFNAVIATGLALIMNFTNVAPRVEGQMPVVNDGDTYVRKVGWDLDKDGKLDKATIYVFGTPRIPGHIYDIPRKSQAFEDLQREYTENR